MSNHELTVGDKLNGSIFNNSVIGNFIVVFVAKQNNKIVRVKK